MEYITDYFFTGVSGSNLLHFGKYLKGQRSLNNVTVVHRIYNFVLMTFESVQVFLSVLMHIKS